MDFKKKQILTRVLEYAPLNKAEDIKYLANNLQSLDNEEFESRLKQEITKESEKKPIYIYYELLDKIAYLLNNGYLLETLKSYIIEDSNILTRKRNLIDRYYNDETKERNLKIIKEFFETYIKAKDEIDELKKRKVNKEQIIKEVNLLFGNKHYKQYN